MNDMDNEEPSKVQYLWDYKLPSHIINEKGEYVNTI
jgi:hypothetical protein